MNSRSPHISLAHEYWKKILHNGGIAIDATCGNGFDTLELAQQLLSHSNSFLYGFDIQQQAIEQTEALLKQSLPSSLLARILLVKKCHSEIDELPLISPPQLIVYNLGYLPGGDKQKTTMTATTLESLRKAAVILAPQGAISVTCYPGHSEGAKEEMAILEWAAQLPHKEWQVCHHRWLNRPASPSLLWVCHHSEILSHRNRN